MELFNYFCISRLNISHFWVYLCEVIIAFKSYSQPSIHLFHFIFLINKRWNHWYGWRLKWRSIQEVVLSSWSRPEASSRKGGTIHLNLAFFSNFILTLCWHELPSFPLLFCSTATNVEIEVPVPADSTNPNIRTSMGSAAYAPENDALVWKIKSFPGGKVFSSFPFWYFWYFLHFEFFWQETLDER